MADRSELLEEIFRREQEYAELCEFNCFGAEDSAAYLAETERMKAELVAMGFGNDEA